MSADSLFPPEVMAQYTAAGYWPNTTICAYLDTAVQRHPEKTAIVDPFGRLTYAALGQLVDRLALAFLAMGVDTGDVVSFQLPNWHQFVVVQYALSRIGAVGNPLIPIYRQRELRFMLQLAIEGDDYPAHLSCFDYATMMRELRPELPALERLYVLGEDVPDDMDSFDALLCTPWEEQGDTWHSTPDRSIRMRWPKSSSRLAPQGNQRVYAHPQHHSLSDCAPHRTSTAHRARGDTDGLNLWPSDWLSVWGAHAHGVGRHRGVHGRLAACPGCGTDCL